MPRERTFVMIKPDGTQRGLIGEIIARFEKRGYKLVAMKYVRASKELLKKHYADLSGKSFFNELIQYVNSGPVVPMVWEGDGIIASARTMIGATDPQQSAPGTIRGDLCIQVGRNVIHGSDSTASATKEINLWFNSTEMEEFKSCTEPYLYEA